MQTSIITSAWPMQLFLLKAKSMKYIEQPMQFETSIITFAWPMQLFSIKEKHEIHRRADAVCVSSADAIDILSIASADNV